MKQTGTFYFIEKRKDRKMISKTKSVMNRKNCAGKIVVAVLFGGQSPEYGISLQSAYSVIKNINREKYEMVLIGITKDGEWFRYIGDAGNIAADRWLNEKDCIPIAVSFSQGNKCIFAVKNDMLESVNIDVVFPVLHGENGEDGTVQGLFEIAGIPVAGCGVLSSALCMDKDKANKLVKSAGIDVPRSFEVRCEESVENAVMQAGNIGFPLIIKPACAGSSYGISKVKREDQLTDALDKAFAYGDRAIVEEFIWGFEVGCAVFEDESNALVTGEIDEIQLEKDFFDFTEKYTLKTSDIYVPARISDDKAKEIKETAKIIYRVLGCRGFARIDMFLDDCGNILFNEVNTIPGFTEHSRFTNMIKAAGISFEQFLSAVIEKAVEK